MGKIAAMAGGIHYYKLDSGDYFVEVRAQPFANVRVHLGNGIALGKESEADKNFDRSGLHGVHYI